VPPRRIMPRDGRRLELSAIRGPWHPSAGVGAVPVFAVRWTTKTGAWWAALHDFNEAAQQHLLAMCRWEDEEIGRPSATASLPWHGVR
jgi:hypothetical protein